ncbi:M56 family metallopeptidase [Rheinheimera metallidurans]|uniref:M56 family metallopeptidase n=1 Tax=Rheinheimera metallidurans TaxID=2925781 RepID=UPI003003919E
MDYIFTNCVISAIAFAVYRSLINAPARLRFYVVITALVAWFVPWNLVTILNLLAEPVAPITSELFNLTQLMIAAGELQKMEEQFVAALPQTVTGMNWLSQFSVSSVFGLLTIVGTFIFATKVYAYIHLLHCCKADSQAAEYLWQEYQLDADFVSLRVTACCDMAMATGISKPVVWLSEELLDSPQLKSILTHELNHIRQHDPAWMWFVSLAHSIFWWNPLVRVLVTMARHSIELSCDERCRHQLKDDYGRDLALLFLHRNIQKNVTHAVMPVSHFRNFNLSRIKNLSKETTMKTRYLLITSLGLTLSTLAAASISDTQLSAKQTQSQAAEQPTNKRLPIYNGNLLHDKQVDELLAINENAKSHDHTVLDSVYQNSVSWYVNRTDTQDPRSELSLKLMSFTMMSYVLNKLERPKEILALYDEMFDGITLKRVMFLQHHRAIAYMQLGTPEKGIELLEQVIGWQPQPKDGSLLLLAQAYLQNNDGPNAIRVAELLESQSEIPVYEMQALNIKRAGYETLGEKQKASEISQLLNEKYGQKSWQPELFEMASPLLAYLPDAE